VIRQYTVDIDPQVLGFLLQAIVRVRLMPGKLHMVQKLIEQIPEIRECDKVTGEDCFVARLHVRAIDQLNHILDRVADHSETNAGIVKAQPVRRRASPSVLVQCQQAAPYAVWLNAHLRGWASCRVVVGRGCLVFREVRVGRSLNLRR